MKTRTVIHIVALALGIVLQTAPAAGQQLRGAHQAAGLACAACHKDGTVARPDAAACRECHGDHAAVAKLTAAANPNPHASHEGELRCTLCHRVHQPSSLYCNQCHQFDLRLK